MLMSITPREKKKEKKKKKNLSPMSHTRPRGCKAFFVLNLAGREIYTAHKC